MEKEESITKEKVSVGIKVSLVLDKFKSALSKVERVVSARSTLPILNNVLIKVTQAGVELSATDLEIGVKFLLGGKVEQEGIVTVPGRTLIGLINNLHGETITLTGKNNILQIECGSSKASINGMSADEFPVIPEVEGGKVIRFRTELFRDMLSAVEFSASHEESRPILTGVNLISTGDSITMAATDSYRLSEVIVKEKINTEFSVVIPARTLQEVKRIIEGVKDFELRVGDNQVMFMFDGASLVSRIIEGEYPNYKQIIPAGSTTQVELDVQELVDALKTASIFSSESSNSVKLEITAAGDIDITSSSSQLGSFSSKLKGAVKGEGGEISFNAKYLLDGLNSFTTPRCEFEMSGKT
ncbi:MAG: DNA polymerase III subunit beta, partial [bacterium]